MLKLRNKRILLLTLLIIASYTFLAFSVSNFSNTLDLAQVLGLFSLQLIWWQVVLGNRFITKWFSRNLKRINHLHRLFGTYGIMFLILHLVLILQYYGIGIISPDLSDPFKQGVLLGMFAFDLYVGVWLVSAVFRRRLSWRLWKTIHLLAYPILTFGLLHSGRVGSDIIASTPYAVWHNLLFVSFAVIIGIRIVDWSGLLKREFEIVDIDRVTHDVTRISLKPLDGPIQPHWGQFAYLQLSRFGEEHPFTISHYEERSDVISFSIKSIGPFSEEVQSLKKGQHVFVDGPYGVFTREIYTTTKPVVFIAGGIGITPFITWVKKDAADYLFIGNKTVKDIAFHKEIEDSRVEAIHVLSEEKVKGYKHGHISEDMIKQNLEEPMVAYEYFVCGPPIMMEKIVEGLEYAGVPLSQIHTEKFSL